MKNRLITLCFVALLGAFQTISAQQSQTNDDRYPFFDYPEVLTHTDTIPEYDSKLNKLKLEGTIFESDGVTPASNVIVSISHADEDGNFKMTDRKGKRKVIHRGWVKTDANGHYTFYTFVPGNDRTYNQLQEIYPLVKVADQPIYEVPTFLFDSDPLLSKYCKKRMAKKDDPTRILKPTLVKGILVAKRNIILPASRKGKKLAMLK